MATGDRQGSGDRQGHSGGPRTASDAGWHLSRYNVWAAIPGTDKVAVANLYRGTCAEFGELEQYLLSVLDELDERNPFVERFARRGVIANFDELAALESMARMACAYPIDVGLTLCPTMGCNFDCSYCFESHRPGAMSAEVQDDVIALARRMLEASGARRLKVTWFGGEPLLAPHVVESLSARLVGLSRELGVNYDASIVTNGYLLTPDVAAMLGEACVSSAQVTLDGLGPTHDATRHLAGGGATFDRIVENLSRPGLPFAVRIRHNVHEDNLAEVERLRAFVEELSRTSGNDLSYHAALVTPNKASDARDAPLRTLCAETRGDLMLDHYAQSFQAGRGHHCAAHSLWHLGVDERGRLHKCWEAVDKPELSFGDAHDWDPTDPIGSARRPDLLTAYLNSTGSTTDAECRACVWLPICRGGCPYQRLHGYGRRCFGFKDDPERYVLALHARIPRGCETAPTSSPYNGR